MHLKNNALTLLALYDLLPAPPGKKVMAVGDWNYARIVSKCKRVEIYLNGVKTVEFERGSEDFR